jgi:hypothetical protein
MASLRDTAECIGVTGDFSVVGDFFGYLAKPDDPSPDPGFPNLSVLMQVRLLQGRHVHLNLIRVGIESFTSDDEAEIDGAVQLTRDLYEQVSLGIGRVLRFFVTTADANGHEHIGSNGEAEALTHDWTVPNDAIDVFFVRSFLVRGFIQPGGLSPIEGPCDKNGVRMNGCVVRMMGDSLLTGFVLAHYVAQYLGLRDSDDNQNVMFNTVPNGGELTPSQGSNMRDHCFVNGGC